MLYVAKFAEAIYVLHAFEKRTGKTPTRDVELARKKIRDTRIKAPFAGWIKQRLVAPGQYLKVQAPVYMMVDMHSLRFQG